MEPKALLEEAEGGGFWSYMAGVPLDPNVRESGDAGKPIAVKKAEAGAAQALNQIARQVAARVSVINLEE